MATAEQLRELIRSHINAEDNHFATVALQIASTEARAGHTTLAKDIRQLIENGGARQTSPPSVEVNLLDGLLWREIPSEGLNLFVSGEQLHSRLNRVLLEYRQMDKLKLHHLSPRRKLLLAGPSGTGKTMTSRILAHELRLPLYTVQIENIVSRYLGETSAKLRQIFDLMPQQPGVYMFDEFDAIGSDRSLDNEVGEMRRVLNSFLQFIEKESSNCIIIAATNNPQMLDKALYRRFDDVLYYTLPDEKQRKTLLENSLSAFAPPGFNFEKAVQQSAGMCQADIKQACVDTIKNVILADEIAIEPDHLLEALRQRINFQEFKEAE